MAYRVEFLPSAARELESLPREVQIRLARRIDALGQSPRPRDAKILHDKDRILRIRVGDYRVLYRIVSSERVTIVKIGHRRWVYRKR